MMWLLSLFSGGWLGWLSGFKSVIVAFVLPLVKAVANVLANIFMWISDRLGREFRALFDVFPFLILLITFSLGGAFFNDWAEVKHVAKERVETVRKVVRKPKRHTAPKPNRKPVQKDWLSEMLGL